jgi:hypothetical protein
MGGATKTRSAFAIAACVAALVLSILWGRVPAELGPCSFEELGDGSENPYGLGTCVQGPSALVSMIQLAVAVLAIATVAVLASQLASRRQWLVGALSAALSGWIGLVAVQIVAAQIFRVDYLQLLGASAIVGAVFFAFGAFVVWAWRKWRPNKSLERTREG